MGSNPGTRPTDWGAIHQLLHTGAYDEAACLLDEVQAIKEITYDPAQNSVIVALRELCLACAQCRSEAAWHQQAAYAAEQSELTLLGRAQTLLDWIIGHQSTLVSANEEMSQQLNQVASAPHSSPARQSWSVRNLLQWVKELFAPQQPPMPTPLLSAAEEGAVEKFILPDNISDVAPFSLEEAETEQADQPLPTKQDQAAAEILPPASTQSTALPVPIAPIRAPVPLPSSQLVIYCLGSFRVYQHDQLLEEWNGLKGQALLKYLIAQRRVPITKDVLMDLFWPDADPEAARRNLHQAVYSLRQTLRRRDPEMQHIQFENNQYLLNPDLSVWIDAEEFQAQVQRGRSLEASGQTAAAMTAYTVAEGLYAGDFLAEDLYEEWPHTTRERFRSLYFDLADRLSDYYLHTGQYPTALVLCQKILTFDRSVEAAHRRLMRCYLAQGQRHLAIRQYQTCVQALTDELDVPPDDETQALYESITMHSAK